MLCTVESLRQLESLRLSPPSPLLCVVSLPVSDCRLISTATVPAGRARIASSPMPEAISDVLLRFTCGHVALR